MANQFLVEIHQYLKEKVAESNKQKKEAEEQYTIDQASFHEGYLKELQLLKEFVSKNYNLTTCKY